MKRDRVALIGLDGSGKSANISRMKRDSTLSDYSFVWVRWEPKLLAPAYWLLNRRLKKGRVSSTESSPSRANETDYECKRSLKQRIFQNRIICMIWLEIAKLDYFVQFYVKTASLLMGGKSIIFDRYYVDLFVDQGLNFGWSPQKISKIIRRNMCLFPNVHKTIYIRTSPETCFKRKDDVPNIEYLLKRYAVYERLCEDLGWFSVDGELPLDEVYSNIKERILHN